MTDKIEAIDFADDLGDEALDRREGPAVTGNTVWTRVDEK